MKKLTIASLVLVSLAILAGCEEVKRKPSRVYMPDMAYSRAVETYSDLSDLNAQGIHYNALPVKGTVKRGDDIFYDLLADTTGSYNNSASLKNPLGPLDSASAVEAERLYLVNCGICHGKNLDGKGPLHLHSDGTDGPYTPAPANFVDPTYQSGKYLAMAEGTMFHSITYGKNLMGSYASQVTPKQRWMIVSYIKSKQQAATKTAAAAAPAAKDSSAAKK